MEPLVVRAVAEGGQVVELVDVVDHAGSEHLGAMLDMVREFFPDEPYAVDRVTGDADRPPIRHGLVVHQFMVLVDGEPAGVSIYHNNLVRGVSAPHFGAVRPEWRRVVVDGHRLAGWLSYEQLRRFRIDAGSDMLGAVGEATSDNARAWQRLGWRILPVDVYAMPVHGWEWPARGLEMRPMQLVWLPPTDIDVGTDSGTITAIEQRAIAAGAAAFLLDTYGLPADHQLVVELTGELAGRPGARRE